MSYHSAETYCKWLSKVTGKNYRLPTEAEWEYAARGGNQSKGYEYSGSNNLEDVKWVSYDFGLKTHPVATKLPNELGIHDMSGNVLEWCNDWYDRIYYFYSPSTNPVGPSTGSSRVLRGGKVSYRTDCPPDGRSYGSHDFGFRVVRVP
jgi:formylglycine-generating enzyme required for sulfatase activity